RCGAMSSARLIPAATPLGSHSTLRRVATLQWDRHRHQGRESPSPPAGLEGRVAIETYHKARTRKDKLPGIGGSNGPPLGERGGALIALAPGRSSRPGSLLFCVLCAGTCGGLGGANPKHCGVLFLRTTFF